MSITWIQAVVGGFALATAVAAGTWAVKLDHISELESRLEVTEKANSLGYPSLVTQINDASASLKTRLVELKSIDDLTADVASLNAKNKTLEGHLKDELAQHQEALSKVRHDLLDQIEIEKDKSQRKISELSDKVRVLEAQTDKYRKEIEAVYSENQSVELEEGGGANFSGGSTAAGFSKASMDNLCSASINGQHKDMKAGDYIEVQSLGRKCRVILESCKYGYPSKANFRFVCVK